MADRTLERILREATWAGQRGWDFGGWWLAHVARRSERQAYLTPQVWRDCQAAWQRGAEQAVGKAIAQARK